MSHDTSEVRSEIDLHNVLKQRVEAGEPIYINGQATPALEAAIGGLANETGMPVKVLQFVAQSDTSQLHNTGREVADAVLGNENVKIAFKI
jgi:hypothetical protein